MKIVETNHFEATLSAPVGAAPVIKNSTCIAINDIGFFGVAPTGLPVCIHMTTVETGHIEATFYQTLIRRLSFGVIILPTHENTR